MLPAVMYAPFLFVFGTVIGSFLNVVILRHEKEEGVGGRSYCPTCHKQLSWYELIPVCSYLFQRGKCVGCKAPIAVQYPLVELVTGGLFVAVLLTTYTIHDVISPSQLSVLIPHYIIWSLLLVITVYDIRTLLIPNRFSFSFAALALIVSLASSGFVWSTLIAGPVLFLPFYALWKYSDGRWMGLGDGKLAWGMGWYLGLIGGLSAVMFAFWSGAALSLLFIGIQRIIATSRSTQTLSLTSEVPFGPYLILGTGLVYFLDYTLLMFVG